MNRCMEMLAITVTLIMPGDINYVSEYKCILMRIFGAFRQSALKTPRSKHCCILITWIITWFIDRWISRLLITNSEIDS